MQLYPCINFPVCQLAVMSPRRPPISVTPEYPFVAIIEKYESCESELRARLLSFLFYESYKPEANDFGLHENSYIL